MESFVSLSASLRISIISEVEGFFFLLLTLAGSSSLLLTSLILEVLARALVCGHWGGLCGQSQLRCPCFLQVKHLPVLMSSVLSSVSIFLALARPGVVSIASGSLLAGFFQAAFHCSSVWGFLHGFESLGFLIPRLERMSRYFCWYFCAALVHSVQFLGSSGLLTIAMYRCHVMDSSFPFLSPHFSLSSFAYLPHPLSTPPMS